MRSQFRIKSELWHKLYKSDFPLDDPVINSFWDSIFKISNFEELQEKIQQEWYDF